MDNENNEDRVTRQLASVQVIKELKPIDGADRIEIAKVLGWEVVVKKGEFTAGDLCVYFEIDSILPQASWNEFLIDKNKPDKPIRLKTIRLRGQISHGLCMPLTILDEYYTTSVDGDTIDIKVGYDLTEFLSVEKYEVPIPACLASKAKGTFPSFLHKTDEIRIQTIPEIIEEVQGKKMYISTKMDGTSATFSFYQDEFKVCSRNLDLIEDDKNTYWNIAKEYNIEDILRSYGDYCIQGEICGPSIQKNPMKFNTHKLFVFNVFDIIKNTHLSYKDFISFCDRHKLDSVPIEEVITFNFKSVEELLERAKGKYVLTDNHKEGIVFRPVEECYSHILRGRLSFKVINNDFLEN